MIKKVFYKIKSKNQIHADWSIFVEALRFQLLPII